MKATTNPTKKRAAKSAATAEKLRARADAAENAVVFLPPDKGIPFPFRSKAMRIGAVDKSLAGVINAAIRRATRAASAAGFAEGIEKAAKIAESRFGKPHLGMTSHEAGHDIAAAIRKATPDAK